MLQPYVNAVHQQELTELFTSVWRNPKYKFYFVAGYPYLPNFIMGSNVDQCWGKEYVSVNSAGDIVGCMGYNTNKTGEIASNLGIISFRDDADSIGAFAADLMQMLEDFFELYGGDSIRFKAIPENPAATHYVRIIRRIGGREVGRLKRTAKLWDGNFYDEIFLQVMKEDYFAFKDKIAKTKEALPDTSL